MRLLIVAIIAILLWVVLNRARIPGVMFNASLKLETRLLWVVGMVASVAAYAAPPPNTDPDSPIGQWFQSLQRNPPMGGSCCDQGDGRVTPNVRLNSKGEYEVLIDERWDSLFPPHWQRIPDEVILRGVTNPFHDWVIFYVPSGYIICAVEPVMG